MINKSSVYLMIAAVLSVCLGTISNAELVIASASPESDSGNSSTEGPGEGGESDQGAVAPEEDSSGTAPPEETPAATEQPTAEFPKCDGSFQECVTDDGNVCKAGQGGHECECAEDMSDCPNNPSLQDEPLPYCDLVDTNVQACSDRNDYDEETGLYPCNDGTFKEDPLDCADATATAIPTPTPPEPIDPCLLDPDNSPTCPPPVDGQCPEGYNMNENGNCFPEHDQCPKGYHSHEDDESGRCIPDSTPCDEGYIVNPDFPSCDLKERVCEENPWLVTCGGNGKDPDKDNDDDNGEVERHKVIIKKINIYKTIHNTADFPEVDVIGLSIKNTGDAMVCIMNIDNDWVQCQEFGVPNDRINENIWRVIETDSNKDYDNGNTGSEDVDSAINGIKSQDFTELDDLDNHDFEIDLAALGINPQGDGLICLIEDDRNEGTALCETFKVEAQAISGQITEITEFA
ncbi:MAG: hypothetical protein ACRD8Z_06525 [Nitrososphaeraceae archaeon]